MLKKKLTFFAIAICLCFLIAAPASSHGLGTVIKQVDGDTLVARIDNTKVRIRLACIDALETGQDGGEEARQILAEILPSGANFSYLLRGVSYSRLVLEIYTSQGESLNEQLLRRGTAVLEPRYQKLCNNLEEMAAQQAYAKNEGIGIWSTDEPVMPWDFRRQQKKRYRKRKSLVTLTEVANPRSPLAVFREPGRLIRPE